MRHHAWLGTGLVLSVSATLVAMQPASHGGGGRE